MKRCLYILIGIFTFSVGVSTPQLINTTNLEVSETINESRQLETTTNSTQPRFQQLGKGFSSYESFKSFGSKPRVAADCIGCGEIGDISIYHNTELKPKLTRYTVQAQCGKGNKYLVERGEQLNEKGQKIGVRCLVSYPQSGAHIFWTEGEEFWFISATSLELAKEFESSDVYRLWKSNVK